VVGFWDMGLVLGCWCVELDHSDEVRQHLETNCTVSN
jgi:hypothetical protein